MTEPNPFDTLLQLTAGDCVPRCLHAVANLGVAEALDDTPQTAEALATIIGAEAKALERVIRILSAYGVFATSDRRASLLFDAMHRGV